MFSEQADNCFRQLGLRGNPFTSTPDTRFFYPSSQHIKALRHMQYGAENASISLVTGDVGSGKTLLCRMFLKEVKNKMMTAYIFNPLQSEQDLLRDIYQDLGGKETSQRSIGEWYKLINEIVIAHARKGKRSVIIIDEAHRLSVRALEILRLLTNLETEQSKLLTIILVGQKELEKKLDDVMLFALKQRISIHIVLKSLSHKEVIDYVRYRLSIAGARSELFSPIALKLLAVLSKGIPRVVNKVSERALLAIFIKEVVQAGIKDIVRSYYETRHGT